VRPAAVDRSARRPGSDRIERDVGLAQQSVGLSGFLGMTQASQRLATLWKVTKSDRIDPNLSIFANPLLDDSRLDGH
jgi:hypothetical protein